MKVWARRPGTYAGSERDFGEVFDLPDGPKREQLLRLGYLEKFSGSAVKCGECSARFTGDAERNMHGQKRHRQRGVSLIRDLDDLGPEELRRLNDDGKRIRHGEHFQGMVGDNLEAEAQQEEKFLEEKAPLYLDKTVASRK